MRRDRHEAGWELRLAWANQEIGGREDVIVWGTPASLFGYGAREWQRAHGD